MSDKQVHQVGFTKYDKKNDVIIDYSGDTHIRVLKNFQSLPYEISEASKDMIEGEADQLERPDSIENSLFHLRFYFPKDIYLDKLLRFDNCIIMMNGLDELQYFTMYDELGQHFAKRGIASVLIPTPYHLNRHDLKKNPRRPHEYLFEKPLLIYHNTKQTMKDITDLVTKFRGGDNPKTEEEIIDSDFYNHNFDCRKIKLSLLGYSLGGLRALSCLFDKPNDFSCCFLLNSGFRLSDLIPEKLKIDKKVWNDFLVNLEKELISPKNINIQTDPYYNKVFSPIFLGHFQYGIEEELKNLSKRVLLIVGGGDEIVAPLHSRREYAFTRELTIFQIPGVKHLLSLDKSWINWVGLTTDLMINFERNVHKNIRTPDQIIEDIRTIGNKYKLFQNEEAAFNYNVNYFCSQIPDTVERREFKYLCHLSTLYYPDFTDVIAKIKRKNTREIESD